MEQLDDVLIPMETGQWIEMEQYRLAFDSDGEARVRQMLIRVFEPSTVLTIAILDCAADSPMLEDDTLMSVRLFSDAWQHVPDEFPRGILSVAASPWRC